MAVSPIINAIQTNRSLYNVSFEGKDKKSHKSGNHSDVMKTSAIPLAALLAMAPISNAKSADRIADEMFINQKPNIEYVQDTIKSSAPKEEYIHYQKMEGKYIKEDSPEHAGSAIVYFSSKKDANKIDKVTVSAESMGYVRLLSLNNLTYHLIGDDGIEYNKISFAEPEIQLYESGRGDLGSVGFHKPNLIKEIRSFLDSGKNDGAVEQKDISRKIRISDNTLQNVAPDTKWIEESRQNKGNFGVLMQDVAPLNVDTEYGKYVVRFYNKNADDSNFECITVERLASTGADGTKIQSLPELELKGLGGINALFFDRGGDIGKVQLGFVKLKKNNSNGTVVIPNEELNSALLRNINKVNSDNKAEIELLGYPLVEHLNYPAGVIAPIEDI